MGCSASSYGEEEQLRQKLSPRQVQMIKRTWSIMAKDMMGNGMLIFRRLFKIDKPIVTLFVRLLKQNRPDNLSLCEAGTMDDQAPPEMTSSTTARDDNDDVFDEAALQKHAKIVMEALGATVESLEDSVFLSNILMALGQIHCGYNVQPDYLERFWPAITYAMHEVLQEEYTADVENTWHTVYLFIIGKMRMGMVREKQSRAKQKKKK